MPHSWFSVEQNINDKIYIKLGSTCMIATIPATNYTGQSFSNTIQNVLGHGFTSTYDITTHRITIYNPQSFKILTDTELSTKLNNTWTGLIYNSSSPNSCNDIIGNRTTNNDYSFLSGVLSLNGFRAVYISSSTLSNYNTIGPNNENNIIKKVPVSADFGYQIIEQMSSDYDYLNVEKLTLSTIDFQLRDHKGNFIPLHGSPISFTIKFSLRND